MTNPLIVHTAKNVQNLTDAARKAVMEGNMDRAQRMMEAAQATAMDLYGMHDLSDDMYEAIKGDVTDAKARVLDAIG